MTETTRKAKERLQKVAHGTKNVGKGSLVVLIATIFGTLFIVFLALLGVRKGPRRLGRKK